MQPKIQSKKKPAPIKIIHATIGETTGRVRFGINTLYRSQPMVEWLTRGLGYQKGIVKVIANRRTATLLIVYDIRLYSIKQLIYNINNLFFTEKPTAINKDYYQRKFSITKSHTQLVPPIPWHCLNEKQVISLCSSSNERGLTKEQVQFNLELYGANRLPINKVRSESAIFWHQFNNLPVFLLLGSAGLSIVTGGIVDCIVILSVVLINAYLGYATESSAEKTVNLLNQVTHPDVFVLRDQQMQTIKSENIALGDILILTPGTYVPADGRIIKTDSLQIDESILTGESLPVHKIHRQLHSKKLLLADRTNMVFRGTIVTSGSGVAIVVATGSSTELGSIQNLMGESKQPDTPLQKQLQSLGKKMIGASLGISFLVFSLGLLRRANFLETLKTAISLAVAAIPEGLPAVATVSFATGIKRLEKHNLLVRHLDAIETLGNIDVICFDKTGTLTLNEMLVTSIYLPGNDSFAVKDHEIFQNENPIHVSSCPGLSQLLKIVALCNEAHISVDGILGSATEKALLNLAIESKINIDDLRSRYPLISTQYRSENRNYMLTVHQHARSKEKEPKILIAAKGRPNEILQLCSHYLKDGKQVSLMPHDRMAIELANTHMADKALRVLGIAYQELNDAPSAKETNLIWLGLVGLSDSCRPGVKEIIETLHQAGIRTVMITGDQSATALAIGKELNIGGKEKLKILDSARFQDLDSKGLSSLVADAHIFSRVSPSHKLHIVQALQRSGKIVAMTGDGINDGPALKVADIGIAIDGQNSDVAQRVADLVIAGKDLPALILGIAEGRAIHQNLKKAVNYIVSQNLSEMIFTFSSVAFGFKEPLTPLQLLWVNLVTDILPELALSQEPPESDVLSLQKMQEDQLISRADVKNIGLQSIVLSTASLMGYFYGVHKYGIGPLARTMGFITLNSASLLHTFSSRSGRHSIFNRSRLRDNKYIPYSIGIGLTAEIVAIYGPFFRKFLKTAPLSAIDLLAALVCSAAPYFIIEGVKFSQNGGHKQLKPGSAYNKKGFTHGLS